MTNDNILIGNTLPVVVQDAPPQDPFVKELNTRLLDDAQLHAKVLVLIVPVFVLLT
jgi:hypothetical protein